MTIVPENPRRALKRLRRTDLKARRFAAAVAVYLFVLKVVFPGYIRPFTPHHNDFYIPPGLAYDEFSFWQHLRFPRPAGFFLLESAGLLRLSGWVLVLIVIALLNVVAVVRLTERLAGREAYPPWALLYMFLVLAHPCFYMDYIHDALATASLFYILLALHAWLTKETYFLAALVFWIVEMVRTRDKKRRAAQLTLAALAVTFFAGVLVNI